MTQSFVQQRATGASNTVFDQHTHSSNLIDRVAGGSLREAAGMAPTRNGIIDLGHINSKLKR
jgi:hypothetical protein